MRLFFILFALIIFPTGCATRYQPEGFTGGYSESQLGDNIFQVSFRGNSYTGQEITTDFTLLRSAELTLQNGFRYFVIVRPAKDGPSQTMTTPSDETDDIPMPSASNTILCFKEKPDGDGLIYDATLVTKVLKKKYRISDQQ
jgi:hypothetical protein